MLSSCGTASEEASHDTWLGCIPEIIPREFVWAVRCRLLHNATGDNSLFALHRATKHKSTFTLYQAVFMVEHSFSRFGLSPCNEIKAKRATKHNNLSTLHQVVLIIDLTLLRP